MADAVIRNDEATGEDSLNRRQYASAFARLAETCETPLVIGLYGGWGIGKSSLMKLIEVELNKDKDKARTVWFDPWQHQFDDLPALSLLHTVVDTFDMQAEGKKLLTVIAAAFGSMLLKATTNLNINDLDKLGERFEEERFLVREAQVRMRKSFEELIKKARGEPERRIIFFIDDLDRCMPKQALGLLEALKLYLNIPGCVYFLGVDRHALEKSIEYHYKDIELGEAKVSYLDKIIQLPFTIPPIAPESMGKFVEPLLSEGLKDCQDILVEGLGDNPRHVKRFINTLMLNGQLAAGIDITNYSPKVLALLLLIQYRTPDLYRIIARQPERLQKLKDEDEGEEAIHEKYLKDDGRLREILALVDIPEEEILKQYIYLTQAAKVTEEVETTGKGFDLKNILAEHKLWLETDFKGGKRADLSRADLSRADLSGADLSGANLSWANLSGANLRWANLLDVTGVTKEQIASARTDADTNLPDYLK